MKKWDDGYLFGKSEVYNPWSVLNQTKEWFDDKDILAMPWWANTSSNNIIRTLIGQADDESSIYFHYFQSNHRTLLFLLIQFLRFRHELNFQ